VTGPGFVHLHLHSSFSLLEGALPIARLAELAKSDRQPALALTDTGNLFGALEFSEKMASAGIQPIIGCSLAVDFGDEVQGRNGQKPAALPRLVLLAANEDGYRNLIRLVSRSFLEVDATETAHVKADWLSACADGLIALTGGPDGVIDGIIGAGRLEVAQARLERLTALYPGRLYIELQRHGLDSERRGLLPDRRRLHPVGEGARHSGRSGPRLRRRLAGRLVADHHRPRSDALRAAVRALPQSRTRVDAGLRHRFLPGPARRGDPLRAGEIRPRPGGADHHLRHAAGARVLRDVGRVLQMPYGQVDRSASWCRRTRPIR
jgi:DNA polymerase III alpha subunit